jgi:hypothetical protein
MIQLTSESRVKAADMKKVINEYGRTVLGVQTKNASVVPQLDDWGWSVWTHFVSEEEGESDLALMLRIIPGPDHYRFVVEDIRVP